MKPIRLDKISQNFDRLIESYLEYEIDFDPIANNVLNCIRASDRFFENDKFNLSLEILISIAIPLFSASNIDQNDCFIRESDHFEYYTVKFNLNFFLIFFYF